MSARGTLCLTFDNMGSAMDVGRGLRGAPDPHAPDLAVGYPRLLALLDELRLHGTFFIEGWNAVHHPERVQELARRGHEVALHGWVHEDFASLSRDEAERVLREGRDALTRIGVPPAGFRAPGGRRGPHAVELLTELGFTYDSSIEHDAADPAERTAFEGRLQPTPLAPGLAHVPVRYAMADSIQYLRNPGAAPDPDTLARQWKALLDRAARARCNLTLVFHAYVSGVDDARFAAMREVLEHAKRSDLEVIGAGALASRLAH